MNKIRISVVKYTNSLPFLYGLENHPIKDGIVISKDTPAECYDKLMNDQADIGLVPVVILNKFNNAEIIGESCIGTHGKVRSVVLASSSPLDKIEKIYLDYQSRTSVNLVQILAKKYWKINPEFIRAEKGFEDHPIPENCGYVIIGDRAFSCYDQNYMIWDLGEEWFRYTGKPFVFACWVSNKAVDPEFIKSFDEAINHGLNNRKKLISEIEAKYKSINVNLEDYFFNKLYYKLGIPEKEGMNLFLNLMRTILNQ